MVGHGVKLQAKPSSGGKSKWGCLWSLNVRTSCSCRTRRIRTQATTAFVMFSPAHLGQSASTSLCLRRKSVPCFGMGPLVWRTLSRAAPRLLAAYSAGVRVPGSNLHTSSKGAKQQNDLLCAINVRNLISENALNSGIGDAGAWPTRTPKSSFAGHCTQSIGVCSAATTMCFISRGSGEARWPTYTQAPLAGGGWSFRAQRVDAGGQLRMRSRNEIAAQAGTFSSR